MKMMIMATRLDDEYVVFEWKPEYQTMAHNVFSYADMADPVTDWCKEHNIRNYIASTNTIGFLSREDAMLCYLRFKC